MLNKVEPNTIKWYDSHENNQSKWKVNDYYTFFFIILQSIFSLQSWDTSVSVVACYGYNDFGNRV
jgi:hypothetical protein